MSMIFHYKRTSLSPRSSGVVSTKQNENFNLQLPAMFAFLLFHKSGLVKSYSSSEDVIAYKIS
jgi:hypothetical protein